MAIPTEGTVTRIEDPTATSDAEAELETVDTSSVGMSLADQIRMKEEERIALEKEQKALAVRRENRQRTLDRVLWESGQTSYGEIRSLRSEESRYAMKLKLDALRGDPAMGEDQRRKELDRLKFAFYEDRGEGRRPSRSIISGLTVNRLEFAEAFPINRFEIERLTVAADNEDAQLRLADGIYESGEYASVADHLDALHSRGMGNPSSFLRLSDCYRRLLRYDDELRVIEQGLARFSDSAQLRAAEGDIYLNIGLVARAIKSYEQALASDPVFPPAHFGLGRAYLSEKRPTEALPHLRQAQSGSGLRDAEERLLALVLLGETYLLLGDLPAAVRTLDTALDRNPEHPRALLGRAVVTLADTGPDAALVYVLRGRGAAPLNGALAYMEGVCTLRIGDYARAYSSLLVAMDLDPLITPEVRTALSYLFEKAGRDELALGEADQGMIADPTHVGARLQKARCLLNVGDLSSARDLYLQALASEPMRADILVALGDVAFRLGEATDAQRYYDRANGLEPNFPDLFGRRLICSIERKDRATTDTLLKSAEVSLGREPFVQAAQGYYYYETARQSEEAIQRLRALGERADAPTSLSTYAKSIVAQIIGHEDKEEWKDDFNYRGTQVLGKWKREVGAGINILPQDGRVRFLGTQKRVSFEPTVLYQEREGRKLESVRVTLDVSPKPGVHSGIGLLAFQRAPRDPDPYPGLQRRGTDQVAFYGGQVAVGPSGQIQFRYLDKGKMSEWVDIPGESHRGGPISIGLDVIDRKDSTYRLVLDGRQSVVLKMGELASRGRAIEVQLFTQAQIDTTIEMSVDQVSIITLKN
jgi:tetratricopeptide (TPR) repeat protein